jgi:hypothetical protein
MAKISPAEAAHLRFLLTFELAGSLVGSLSKFVIKGL